MVKVEFMGMKQIGLVKLKVTKNWESFTPANPSATNPLTVVMLQLLRGTEELPAL
jgi:hypothetical protein